MGADPLLSCRDPPEGTGACSDWCSNYYFTDLATGGLRVCIANPEGNQCKNTDPVDVCPPSPPPPGPPTLDPNEAGTGEGSACDTLRNQCRAVSYSYSDHGCNAYAWGKSPSTLNNEYTGNVLVNTPAATALDLASCYAWCDATFSSHSVALTGCKTQTSGGATSGCLKMKELVDAAPAGTCTADTTPQPPAPPTPPPVTLLAWLQPG